MEQLDPLKVRDPVAALKSMWSQASMAQDFATAERLGNAILEMRPEDAAVRYHLARILTELDRKSDARVHWKYLRDTNSRDLEAAFQIARESMESGQAIEAAIRSASPLGSPRLRQNLRELLVQRIDKPERPFRHVAICGFSWCGSTLMDHVLGSLPGARSIGESHYLPMERGDKKAGPADFSSDAPPPFVPCSVCGQVCAAFSPEFRRELAADRTRWFARIAERLDADILVSADKVPARLIECDPLLRFDAIVLFKTPVQAWLSKLRKLPPDREASFYVSECDQHLSVWARTYRTLLDHFHPRGKVAFVCFDEFTRRPAEILEKLCVFLSLPFSGDALVAQRAGHAIAGSHRTLKKLRQTNYHTEILPLTEPDLSAAQKRRIAAHEAAQGIAARLQSGFQTLVSE